jgi:single-strand DNA-binding protein
VRSFANGGQVCTLNVATSEAWKDRASGERRERTEWHRVTIHAEGLVRIAEQYLRKGSKVYIEGQLETRKWHDQSGQERFTTEITLRPYRGELVLLDGRTGGEPGGQSRGDEDRGYGARDTAGHDGGRRSTGSGYGAGGRPGANAYDDEIPFMMEARV